MPAPPPNFRAPPAVYTVETPIERGEAVDDEQDLIRRARGGDRSAFALLMERHTALVRSLAALYLGRQEAADAAQDIWLTVFRKLWQLDDGALLGPWLRTLVFYHCVNLRRARARRGLREVHLGSEDWFRLAECVGDGGACLEDISERRELRRQVSRQLDRLPAGYGMILRLRYARGLSYQEIVDVTHLPLSTVKWRLHAARRMLQARLATMARTGRVPQ